MVSLDGCVGRSYCSLDGLFGWIVALDNSFVGWMCTWGSIYVVLICCSYVVWLGLCVTVLVLVYGQIA